MAVTLSDIAKHLGVAKSTVSVTLRNHPAAQRFNPETRQRILEAAQELGYRPNFFAAQLSSAKRRLLMLCMGLLRDHWASNIAEGFELQATKRGYRVMVTAFHDRENPLAFDREVLSAQGVPALAVVGVSAQKMPDPAIVALAEESVRVVLVGREVDHPRVSHVLVDNHAGGEAAAHHLYEQGLENVWVLSPRDASASMLRRVEGCMRVATALGRPAPTVIRCGEGPRIDRAYEATAAMLKRRQPPQGIYAVTDLLAIGASHALMAAGCEVGREVAVVGFDGGIHGACSWPPLTSIRQPMAQMGVAAADMLIDQLEKPQQPARRLVLPPELVVRCSSVLSGAPEPWKTYHGR